MSFDPQKVERWFYAADVKEFSDTVVSASDYDRLLQLYLEARLAAESYADALQYPGSIQGTTNRNTAPNLIENAVLGPDKSNVIS